METPCYTTIKLGEYLQEQDERDRLESAAEKLQNEMYTEVEKAAKTHPLLEQFIDKYCDQLCEFLMAQAFKQLKASADDD